MTKRSLTNYLLASFLLILFGQAVAQEGRVGLTAMAGVMFPGQDNLEAGASTGFGLLLRLAGRTRAGIQFLASRLNSRGNPEGLGQGSLILTPFLLVVQQDLVSGRFFKVQLAGGAGLIFSDFRGKAITIPEVTITQKIPVRPAVHLELSIAFPLTDRLVLCGQAGTLYSRASGQTTIRDMNLGQTRKEFSMNLSSQTVFIGLIYYFK
jgi:hypothetical protein